MTIFRQATAPTYEAGGLWFDSDAGDTMYYGVGGSWVLLGVDTDWNAFTDGTPAAGDKLVVARAGAGINLDVADFVINGQTDDVGLGTASPVKQLVVSNGGANGFEIEPREGAFTRLLSYNRVSVAYTPLYIEAAEHRFLIDGAEKARVNGSGIFCVGATGHAVTNQSGHTIDPQAAGVSNTITGHANGTATGQPFAYYCYNGGIIGGIVQNGTTGVSYNTSSDYRLKEAIADLTGSGAFIDALRPRQGAWKADQSPFAGFLAHEFAEVSPASVTGDKDAVDDEGNPVMQSMQASSPEVMANIIAELQSLRARVAALEAGA